jgi:antitoxin component HigA of HigAB toxin-antitoxin module
VTKARQPSRPARWAAAIAALTTILDEYQAWRDRLPEAIGSTSMAERLDDLLGLRDLVEQLAEAELPKGFGRD